MANRRGKAGIVIRFIKLTAPLTVMILATGFADSVAQSTDPHRLYEQNCGGCHTPHAGDFVENSLDRSDDGAVGRSSRKELRAFLEAGHGRLTPDEIESITTHLMSILTSGRVFHRKCIACHDRAVKFARLQLVIRDGELTGRYSKRNIEAFLSGHGRLEPDEVPMMVDVLKRQLQTDR